MNIGAQGSDAPNYDEVSMKEDASSDELAKQAIRTWIIRECDESIEWYQERGNSGDNVDITAFRHFQCAIRSEETEKAVKFAVEFMENKMHPTAKEIMSGPIHNFVYNVCGKRMHNYEI